MHLWILVKLQAFGAICRGKVSWRLRCRTRYSKAIRKDLADRHLRWGQAYDHRGITIKIITMWREAGMKATSANLAEPQLIRKEVKASNASDRLETGGCRGFLAAWRQELTSHFCSLRCLSAPNPKVFQGPSSPVVNKWRSMHFAPRMGEWCFSATLCSLHSYMLGSFCFFETMGSAEGIGIPCVPSRSEATIFHIFKNMNLLLVANLSSNVRSFKKQPSIATKHLRGGGEKSFQTSQGEKRKRYRSRVSDLFCFVLFWDLHYPWSFFPPLNAAKQQLPEKQPLIKTLFHVFHCEPEKILWDLFLNPYA